jgi:hypothetical protein
MNDLQQIVPGAFVQNYDLDARFTRGSLEGLAAAVRDAVWRHLELFESADQIRVFVGGNRKNSLDPPLEVVRGDSGRGSRFVGPPELMRALQAVRRRNLPARENTVWECTCAVYCDQAHGEGRIELRILKPTFHEMAAVAA